MRNSILMGVMALWLLIPTGHAIPYNSPSANPINTTGGANGGGGGMTTPNINIIPTQNLPTLNEPHHPLTLPQLITHLQTLPDDEATNVFLRGDSSLGKCSLRKSNGSSSCKYRLMNHNKTVFCFNDVDPALSVVGVAHGNWANDTDLNKNPLSGAPFTTPKQYFNNVRNALSVYSNASTRVLGYIRSYLLKPSNPCQISLAGYQQPADLDISNPTQFTFYKNHLTKEIFCSNNLLANPVWDPKTCSYKTQRQFFDPRWCKKLYTQFYTRSVVSVTIPAGSGGSTTTTSTTVPVSQISFATLGETAMREATIQMFPPELGLLIEDATTRIAFYDVVEPRILAVAENNPGQMSALVNGNPPDLATFIAFHKLVKSAKLNSTTFIPFIFRQVFDQLDAISMIQGQSNSLQMSFDDFQVRAAKVKLRITADDRVGKALSSAGLNYEPAQFVFGEYMNCNEAIQSSATSSL